MGTLVIAYLLGGAAISAYLGWLVVQNAHLVRRQQELKKMLAERDQTNNYHSTAA